MIDQKIKVDVYRNLHKKCWSIRQRGKVVAHKEYIVIRNAEFVVGKKGRERVLRERKKYVHAFVRGYIVDPSETLKYEILGGYKIVTYDPYKYDSFVITKFERIGKVENYPIYSAAFCDMLITNCEPLLAWDIK